MSRYLKVKKKDSYVPITIRIEIYGDDDVVAFHGTEIIGRFEFVPTDEGSLHDLELLSMNVDPDYQRLGIGKSLMRYAVNKYGEFLLPKPENFVYATNRLTIEGAHLINSCFKNKILSSRFENQYDQNPY